MSIKLLTDYPALFIPEEKILVISDLHIGLEHQLYQDGIIIPSQSEKFKKIIDRLIQITDAKTLIILGDIKHKVPGISFREEKEIPKLLEHLVEKVKVILTLGNHDTELKGLIPKGMRIYSSRGLKIGKYGFFHGHAWPSKKLMICDYLFMGHIHPCVEFVDRFGYRSLEEIWVKGKLDENLIKKRYEINKVGKLRIIILPAFNHLLGGIALNRVVEEELIGPLLANKFFDIRKAKAYLIDGTFLGSFTNF
ncbi:MAG: metallophosphoesterase [Candidatus Aenigmatarchaeota archaeon]